MKTIGNICFVMASLFVIPAVAAQTKAKLTLDSFFNSVSYTAVELSPDGDSIVIAAERADWDQQIFRTDLYLYHPATKRGADKPEALIQLTQSGHDTEPKWSPDGKYIAFLSERKNASEKDSDDADDKKAAHKKEKGDKGDTAQVYLISPDGGEAIALTQGEEEVRSFCWAADSRTIYYSTRSPWTKSHKDEYKKEWKDTVQYRTDERGDSVFALDVASVISSHAAAPGKIESSKDRMKDKDEDSELTPGAQVVATSPLRVENLIASPDGKKLAFLSNAINQRQEKPEDYEIYLLNLTNVGPVLTPANAGPASSAGAEGATKNIAQPVRLTHNRAQETNPRWAADSRHIFFSVEVGDVSDVYRDLQPHLYWVDSEKAGSEKPGAVEQWAKDFPGEIVSYNVYGSGAIFAGRLGTDVQVYGVAKPSDSPRRYNGFPGTYEFLATAQGSLRFAYIFSSLTKPQEVYLSEATPSLTQDRSLTSFNRQLADSELPQGKSYRWKADDGTQIEGMLIYPPGKFEEKNLPLFTFIHGGPAFADGDHFEADWYEWSRLAATEGWLVFEPNYRGSTGYGDTFLQQIVPQIVSRPGKDILEGVDALVKDGIADPHHLTVGGYSYGGYMTNWLITQTTRFKAAVTGAGAVEHLANWGNDDTTSDDAYFLGGRPWEAPQRYHDEAAIFQIDKVRTPTHIVAGADDIRVAVLEDYLLEHALYSLGVPNKLLIFPGEGHGLRKNPWHGKIKVREELEWLKNTETSRLKIAHGIE